MNLFWRRVRFLAIVAAGALLFFVPSSSPSTAKQILLVFFVLVGGLIFLQVSFLLKSFISDREAGVHWEGAQSQSAQSLVGFLLKRKARQSSIAYLFLFIALFVYWYVSALFRIPVRIEALFFILALIVANFVGQRVLEYRVKKGFFGANEYEAREIIGFMLSNTNWSEFTGGRGGKGIFPESEEELIHSADALDDVKGINL